MADSADAAVGIDLGTTFSVLAHVDSTGRPATISNAEGDLLTPSALFFDRTRVVVGREAVRAAEFEPERVALAAKRQMGQRFYEPAVADRKFPPEVLQALVLRKLVQDAEPRLGPIGRAVITVPAYFNEPRRRATQDAGCLAGLHVLDIINEPTAAAIAFGVQQGFLTAQGESLGRQVLLVYDLGGGTFDVTLMEIVGSEYRTIATAGDVHLGGMDWDQRLVDLVAERFRDVFGIDPRRDAQALARLRREANDAKHALTARDEATLQFLHAGHQLRTAVSRAEFEELTGNLLDRTLLTTATALKNARLQWRDVTRLLLVGGATRMPMIPQRLLQESGLAPDRSLAADEAVAHGAAIYAALLATPDHPRYRGISVRDVNSHDLGVLALEPGTGMRRRRVLIPKNTPLPAAGLGDFVTRREGQRSVRVSVVEGGDITGSHAAPIGKCAITQLPPQLPTHSRVRVSFNYSTGGLLSVGASLPGTGRQTGIAIQRSSALDDAALEWWQAAIARSDLLTSAAPAAVLSPACGGHDDPPDADEAMLADGPHEPDAPHEAQAPNKPAAPHEPNVPQDPAAPHKPDLPKEHHARDGQDSQADRADAALAAFLKALGDK